MKKGTAVCIIIMAASFVLSIIFLIVSASIYISCGTKEVASRIREGNIDELADSFEWVRVDEENGVKVDLPGIKVIVDDKGVDVNVIGVHVDMRDDDENEKDEPQEEKETEKSKEETT
ncbi:MAG: hypothetical protein J6Y08_06720 [Clostridiales bacterium]|nr:hypothetical protein [Clostridiales bacterium]